MYVLVLQHIACESPGVYEDVSRERGATVHRVELDENERLPDWHGFDAIIAMGGPMSVNDEDKLPWIRDEKALINNAVRAGVPFFGACLGAQLLAAGLGRTVFCGPAPEVGLLPVFLTSEAETDPVFADLPPELDLSMAWWRVLTAGGLGPARQFASFPASGFSIGNSAYGIQFHLEVSLDMAKQWVEVREYAQFLNDALGLGAAANLITQYGKGQEELRGRGKRLFERWLDLS